MFKTNKEALMNLESEPKEETTLLFQERIKKEPGLKFLEKLKQELPQAEVYLVGGMVRDTFLKRPSKDYDFIVRKVQPEILADILRKHGEVNLVGRNFGVFKFQPRQHKLKEAIDIALPRTEKAQGTGGYHDFEVQTDPNLTIEEDLRTYSGDILQKYEEIKNALVELETSHSEADREIAESFKVDLEEIEVKMEELGI